MADIVKVKIKRLNKYAIIPTKGSKDAMGMDLYAAMEDDDVVIIPPHETRIIGTGLSIELPQGTFGAIFARSGLASKQGLRPANCVGACDSDYRGEYKVALHNDLDEPTHITRGDRIAQLSVLPFIPVNFEETDELSETERGNGGFGSTGK